MRAILSLLLVCSLIHSPVLSRAAEKSDAKEELKSLITKIQGKLRDNQNTEEALKDEIKEFDKLLAKHKGEATEDVAQILYMKARLYVEVFQDFDKATEMFRELKKQFPNTAQAKDTDETIAALQRQREAQKIQNSLVPGAPFPDFKEKDLDGKPISVSAYKGKVLLVDFWATWCPPCIGELPNVLQTYEKYHSKGFEIVGITLDTEEKTLRDFLKKRGMPWQQYYEGKGWDNKLTKAYGVMGIPMTFLLDKNGKIAAKSLRGEALEQAVARLLDDQPAAKPAQ